MIKQFNHSIQCFTVSRTCAPIKIKLFLLDGVWTKSNLNGIWWILMRFRQLFFIVYPFEWAFKEESVRSRRHLSVNWLPNKAQSFKGKKVLTTFQRILRGNVVAICHEYQIFRACCSSQQMLGCRPVPYCKQLLHFWAKMLTALVLLPGQLPTLLLANSETYLSSSTERRFVRFYSRYLCYKSKFQEGQLWLDALIHMWSQYESTISS